MITPLPLLFTKKRFGAGFELVTSSCLLRSSRLSSTVGSSSTVWSLGLLLPVGASPIESLASIELRKLVFAAERFHTKDAHTDYQVPYYKGCQFAFQQGWLNAHGRHLSPTTNARLWMDGAWMLSLKFGWKRLAFCGTKTVDWMNVYFYLVFLAQRKWRLGKSPVSNC